MILFLLFRELNRKGISFQYINICSLALEKKTAFKYCNK